MVVRRFHTDAKAAWSSLWDSYGSIRCEPISPEEAEDIGRERNNGNPDYKAPADFNITIPDEDLV